jgi:hypothetical protein
MEITGPITGGVVGLHNMLVASTAYRDFLGVDSEEAASARTYLFDLDRQPAELVRLRPFAVIWHADKLDLEQYAGGQQNFLQGSGELVLVLTDNDRHPKDSNAGGLDFAAKLDAILLDLAGAAGESDNLSIRRVGLFSRILHNPREDEASAGSYWHAAFLIGWK